MLITLSGSWARRSRGSDFGDKSSSLGSQLSVSMWKRSENPMTKKKHSCLSSNIVLQYVNSPIFLSLRYIYMASAIMCASSYMCNVHRWNTPDLQLRKVRVIECQSRIERFPCIQFLCHYSPGCAGGEQRGSKQRPLHQVACTVAAAVQVHWEVIKWKCSSMHQCIGPWPLLCSWSGILK